MSKIKSSLKAAFSMLESGLDRIFGPSWNPLHNLGALGFFYYWIVAVSGIYLYIGFDTGVERVYSSIERLTYGQWYLGGVMRSFHRYASDALVVMMLLHLAREFAYDRLRGVRWFSWMTGVPILWLVYASGISGYWLVWDELAQYVAIATTEWLDTLPIFGEPIARNFLAGDSLDDRFFTLLTFLHIAIPLILLFVLWLHLQRITRPRINPPRGLAAGTLAMLLALSFAHPAVSHPPADLSKVPGNLHLDWFYLAWLPLFDLLSYKTMWVVAALVTAFLGLMPWLPPFRRPKPATVDLAHCNGCARCVADCPYSAIALAPRSDGRTFTHQAVVNDALCVSCGICVASCPTSMPFRRSATLATGIDLPDPSLHALRELVHAAAAGLSGPSPVLVFGCDHSVAPADLADEGTAMVSFPCIGALPPSFIDYVLSRNLAEGVFVTGCREGTCVDRLGPQWTEARLAGARDPQLRKRVPRSQIAVGWADAHQGPRLSEEIREFRRRLSASKAGAAASPDVGPPP